MQKERLDNSTDKGHIREDTADRNKASMHIKSRSGGWQTYYATLTTDEHTTPIMTTRCLLCRRSRGLSKLAALKRRAE